MRLKPLAIGKRSSLSLVLALSAGALSAACSSESVVHGVNEREANRIIEVLSENDITANKITNAAGREIVYDISVSGSQRLEAIKVLNDHELPRRRDRGYAEIFAESGLIPTSSEEKAKRLAALEGEIERQLKLVDGVLDVEVQIVSPEESALRTTREQEPVTTASVTLKYLLGADGAKPLTDVDVQNVVAAGVEKLTPRNVVVLMRPVDIATKEKKVVSLPFAKNINAKTMAGIVVGIGVLIVLLVMGLIFSQWQVRSVRGRLNRLQNEIAKARKKPVEALQAQAAAGSGIPPS